MRDVPTVRQCSCHEYVTAISELRAACCDFAEELQNHTVTADDLLAEEFPILDVTNWLRAVVTRVRGEAQADSSLTETAFSASEPPSAAEVRR